MLFLLSSLENLDNQILRMSRTVYYHSNGAVPKLFSFEAP